MVLHLVVYGTPFQACALPIQNIIVTFVVVMELHAISSTNHILKNILMPAWLYERQYYTKYY
jgi:hypothetical protein